LFQLYAGGAQRAGWHAGAAFTARNRKRTVLRLGAGGATAVPQRLLPSLPAKPLPRPKVAVPRVGCGAGDAPAAAAPVPPRRRAAAQILSDLRAAEDGAWQQQVRGTGARSRPKPVQQPRGRQPHNPSFDWRAQLQAGPGQHGPRPKSCRPHGCRGAWRRPQHPSLHPHRQVPLPAGPLLDEAEKARCALLMQHRGKLPAPPAPRPAARVPGAGGPAAAAAAPPPDSATPAGALLRMQARFDMLAREVSEREAWQADMRGRGLARPGHAAVIQGEVAARAAEMVRLDARMRAVEAAMAAMAAAAGEGATPAVRS
jgi:hypothetical protein